MDKILLGKQGEEKAGKFLEEKGYKILENNYHKRSGEIDIIAFDPNYEEYVFVEVKTRRNTQFGYPEEAIDDQKMNKITETAETWLIEKEKPDVEWRIDIIAIELKEKQFIINHIQNVS